MPRLDRSIPLDTVRVGDAVRLLADHEAPADRAELRSQPNSTLGIPQDSFVRVTEILVTDGVPLIGVEGSDRRLDIRRFTAR